MGKQGPGCLGRAISGSLNSFTGFRDNVANNQAVVVGSGRQSVTGAPGIPPRQYRALNLKTAISEPYHRFNFAK